MKKPSFLKGTTLPIYTGEIALATSNYISLTDYAKKNRNKVPSDTYKEFLLFEIQGRCRAHMIYKIHGKLCMAIRREQIIEMELNK